MILPDFIANIAQTTPKKIAFHFRDSSLTYGELHDKILRCTQGLANLGIKKGTTFAVLLRNCPEFVILSMALSKLGAVVVPINFLEKPERIALILNDAKAVGILTAKEFFHNVALASVKVKTLEHGFLREGSNDRAKDFNDLLKNDPWNGESDVSAEDLMMLLYTSGTTGLPKGVMLTHKNFIANTDQCLKAIKLSHKDRFICLLPMFHSFAWTTCVLIPLSLGARIIIIESLLPFDPVIKSIWKHKVSIFVAVPQIYAALAQKIQGAKAFIIRLINPVRLCISGAAPLLPDILSNFEKNLGVPLLEGYGLTETAPVASFNRKEKRKSGTVGPALPGVEIELRDDEDKAVELGEVGEIWIRGENVMLGYYNKPDETKAALTPDGWLRTGDLGQLDEDGYLTIAGRKKDLIITKGLNVYPQEIENVIGQHPAVAEVAVVGKMDKETGEEQIRAFVTEKKGEKIDKSEIFSLCRKELAAYKRPREILIIKEMPKNALQKILKKDLRKL